MLKHSRSTLLSMIVFSIAATACGEKQVLDERSKIASTAGAPQGGDAGSQSGGIPGGSEDQLDQVPSGDDSSTQQKPAPSDFKIEDLGDFPEIKLTGKVTVDGKDPDFIANTIASSRLPDNRMVFFQKDGSSIIANTESKELNRVTSSIQDLKTQGGQILSMGDNDFWFFSEKRVSRSPLFKGSKPVTDKDLLDFDLGGIKHTLAGFKILAVTPVALIVGNDAGLITAFLIKGTTFQVYDAMIPIAPGEKIPLLGAGLTDSSLGLWVASEKVMYVIRDVASDKNTNWGKYTVKASTGEGTIQSLAMIIAEKAPSSIVGRGFGFNGQGFFSQEALDLKGIPAAEPPAVPAPVNP